jgi:hypothetical protein
MRPDKGIETWNSAGRGEGGGVRRTRTPCLCETTTKAMVAAEEAKNEQSVVGNREAAGGAVLCCQ